ncbi:LLM class flavin-dependent oxidoreductase [Sorangium sp. So ce693]|uniref:LLM class flavin-dependent oxidoreductase n=1 Tax=Sorangium sp. So ce693 TaxID=3133318 RepID=UPI003F64121A
MIDRGIGIVELARAVEARGFDSRYLPEHTHIPASRRTPHPAGGELPDDYRRTLDPFVALSAAAAVTSRIRLGTGICLVARRDPIVTAKEVATLDLVSGGRFGFGIGVGWNEDEAINHGVDFRRRRALWSDEVASFEGELVHLPTRRSSFLLRCEGGRGNRRCADDHAGVDRALALRTVMFPASPWPCTGLESDADAKRRFEPCAI